jgi:cyclophilin family peptidyl-prolyl cis-trans isomerase
MARGPELNSATSQYFFNLADNTTLDTANGGYAVFGKIISGIEVLDAMSNVKTTTAFGLADLPANSVIVKSVSQTK